MSCETIYSYPPHKDNPPCHPPKNHFYRPPNLTIGPCPLPPYCPPLPKDKHCKPHQCCPTHPYNWSPPSLHFYPEPKCDNVVKVDYDINKSETWTSDKIYLILREVHVMAPATLFIEKGTKVLFRECELCNPLPNGLSYASLVVDPGAAIQARRVEFNSQNGGINNTGGVIICGTLKDAIFEDYDTVYSKVNVSPACSKLQCCSFNGLGQEKADINALTLFYLDSGEFFMSNLSIDNAGDDALEVFGGNHTIDNLSINRPLDDGLDLDDNATFKVSESITIIGNTVTDSETGDVKGPGLVEVQGVGVNTFYVMEGARVYMIGRITDKTTGTTTFSGLFAGAVAGQSGSWVGDASIQTFIMS